MEYQIQHFVSHPEVKDMIAAEMENFQPHRNAPVLARLLEVKLTEALQFICDATKEEIKTPLFQLVGEVNLKLSGRGGWIRC